MDDGGIPKGVAKIEAENNKQENRTENNQTKKNVIALAVFIVGNGIIGAARLIAGDFEKPTTFWINLAAILLSIIVTGISLYEAFPRAKTLTPPSSFLL